MIRPMIGTQLGEFITTHRADILLRCKVKMAQPDSSPPGKVNERGIPLFLDQIVKELSEGPTQEVEIKASALQHGRDLFLDGFTVGQLVHDYGGVCQSITDLAVAEGAIINPKDFRTLNRCLDDAIAGAVASFATQARVAGDREALRVRDLVYVATTAFDVLREGTVGVGGATGDLLHRSLTALHDLVGRPVN
jgi:hypothetical protein